MESVVLAKNPAQIYSSCKMLFKGLETLAFGLEIKWASFFALVVHKPHFEKDRISGSG